MNDSSLMKVVNSRHDLSHELSRFVFVKFLLLVDMLHQFSTYALGIEKKVNQACIMELTSLRVIIIISPPT